jgi:hypothetical protein
MPEESWCKAAEQKEDEDTLEGLDAKICEASEAQKASQTLAKELHKKKKELKAWTGIKQQCSSKGSRCKTTILEDDDLVNKNTYPVQDAGALAGSQPHYSDLQDNTTYCQLTFDPATLGHSTNYTHLYAEGESWCSTVLDPSLDPAFMVPPTAILEDQLNLLY